MPMIPDTVFIDIVQKLQHEAKADTHSSSPQLPLHLLLPAQHERWQQAVQRLQQLIQLNRQGEKDTPTSQQWHDVDDALAQGNAFLRYPPVTAKKCTDTLKQHGLTQHLALQDLFCTHGAFQVYPVNWETGSIASTPLLEIYRHSILPDVLPLPQAVANNWSDNFFQTELTAAHRDELGQRFFAFGRRRQSTPFGEIWHYLLTDREGRLGTVAFSEEDYPASHANMMALLRQGLLQTDFNTFMTEQIQATLHELLTVNNLLDANE